MALPEDIDEAIGAGSDTLCVVLTARDVDLIRAALTTYMDLADRVGRRTRDEARVCRECRRILEILVVES